MLNTKGLATCTVGKLLEHDDQGRRKEVQVRRSSAKAT